MIMATTVQRALEAEGVHFERVPHPRTYSAQESAASAHVPPDHLAKAVILNDAAGAVMVVVPAGHWVKLDTVREELDRPFLDFAEEGAIVPLFADCAAGAIPPLGPDYGLQTLLDDNLAMLANVYFEAGDHEALVHVSGEGFLRLLAGARRGYFSHPA